MMSYMLKLLRNLSKKDYLCIFLCIGLVVFEVWLDLTMPDYTAKLTQAVSGGAVTMSDVWENGGMMMLCALGSMAASIVCGLLAAMLQLIFQRH